MVDLRFKKVARLRRFFKADAKADGPLVVVGGFEAPSAGSSLFMARWFSLTLTPELAPWAFIWENEAYRTIASLELFASLLCLVLFVSPNPIRSDVEIVLTGVTDNAGNEALMSRLMTSKFPLCLVLLELSEQMQARGCTLDLHWRNRETNQAADDLTNLKFDSFNPELRIKPNLQDMPWIVLTTLMQESMAMYTDIRAKRQQAAADRQAASNVRVVSVSQRKRKASNSLRQRQPW
jgi:hypothetical protein